MGTLHEIEIETLNGESQRVGDYAGKALLIVNVASHCGFTPQYSGLEALWRQYRDRGLVVMGFPCNQFGAQEPGSPAEIGDFCQRNYGVSFPLFAKIEVNGQGAHPLYRHLKAAQPGVLGTEAIKWNFTKFLVSPAGEVVGRFAPTASPESLAHEIEQYLPSV